MKRSINCVLLWCAVILCGLFSQGVSDALGNGAELVFRDSGRYRWVEADLLQGGRSMPTSVYPLSGEEFNATVLREETPDNSGIAHRLIFSVNPFFCGFDMPYGKFDKFAPVDVLYLHDEIPPLLEVGGAVSIDNYFHASVVIDQTPGFDAMYGSDYYAPWRPSTILPSGDFPRESYVSLSLPHMRISMGRFKSGIGHGFFGNTFLNGKAPYYDQIQATLYGRKWKFFYMIGSSNTYLTPMEYQAQKNNPTGDAASAYADRMKMFAYHRLEYQPVDMLTVGFGEMNIIGGKFPDFNHINPVGIWHNTYSPACSNVMGSADISFVPLKGVLVYGEFTMDDLRTKDESEQSNPRAFAYQGGLKYVLPVPGDVKHVLGVECTHVDTWTYNRDEPYTTMYQRQVRRRVYIDIPLGFTDGGDLNHFGGYYTLIAKSGFELTVSYQRLDKGQVQLGLVNPTEPLPAAAPETAPIPWYSYSHDFNSAPSGIVEHHDIFEISAAYPIMEHFDVTMKGHYSNIRNFQNQKGNDTYILMYYIGIGWRY